MFYLYIFWLILQCLELIGFLELVSIEETCIIPLAVCHYRLYKRSVLRGRHFTNLKSLEDSFEKRLTPFEATSAKSFFKQKLFHFHFLNFKKTFRIFFMFYSFHC